jgi:hypothetical protein
MRRIVSSMLVALGTVTLAAPSALAASWPPESRSTDGAAATCTVSTGQRAVHDDLAFISCRLSDTKTDGDAVYVAWQQDGFATISLYNRNGAGTSIDVSDGRQNNDGSFSTLRWKVCRDRQAPLPDSCSGWVTYRT